MTVEFDPKTNKLKWYLIDKEQAQKFIDFLVEEIERHFIAKRNAEMKASARRHHNKDEFVALLWDSSVRKHQDDIEDAQHLIVEVKNWFKLEATNGR